MQRNCSFSCNFICNWAYNCDCNCYCTCNCDMCRQGSGEVLTWKDETGNGEAPSLALFLVGWLCNLSPTLSYNIALNRLRVAGPVLQTRFSLIRSVSQLAIHPFVKISSKLRHSQTVRARELILPCCWHYQQKGCDSFEASSWLFREEGLCCFVIFFDVSVIFSN